MSIVSVAGTNLFAYCSNDPVNLDDENGQFSILSAIVGVTSTVVTGVISGDPWYTVAVEAVISGVIGGFNLDDATNTMLSAVDAFFTFTDCLSSGVGVLQSFGCAVFQFGASYISSSTIGKLIKGFGTGIDADLVNFAFDMTFGLGAEMCSAGLTRTTKDTSAIPSTSSSTMPEESFVTPNYKQHFREHGRDIG